MNKISKISIIIIFFSLFNASVSFADTNIDIIDRYAKVLLTGDLIDFNCSYGAITPTSRGEPTPQQNEDICNVMVSSYTVTGSTFGRSVGLIDLSPDGGGVLNDTRGNLSGYAWGEDTGWINFAPQNGGVWIDRDGFFHGMAWSENYGWIVFNCDTDGTCGERGYRVRTSWRPAGGGGGGGSPSGPVPTPPSSSSSTTVPSTPSSTETPGEAPSSSPNSSSTPSQTPSGITPAETGGQPSILTTISELISRTFENFASAIHTIQGDIAIKTVAAVGIMSAALSTPLSSWRSLLSLLALKKRKPWGTVYDSITKQPLDPAYVVLEDMQGNEVSTSITDLDGRYGFIANPGKYRIIANKTNYVFPSRKLADRMHDELYQDLYFGGEIEIKSPGDVILKNIPMDALDFDWNEFAKKQKRLMKFYSKRDLWLARASSILFGFGFATSLFASMAAPKPVNFIIVALYVAVFILRKTILKPKPQGYVSEKSTGLPLSFAILRIFSASLNTEIIHKVTNEIGKYYCLVPNGTYYAKIEKKNPDGSYAPAYTSEQFEVTKGYIKKSFEI